MTQNESAKLTHNEHGVFVVVSDLGVLIRGKPGIGKSSLALELVDRGHALVADDVVQFDKNSLKLIGASPPMLFNLLAVRDIGILNISRLYSEHAIRTSHSLDFVIELSDEIGTISAQPAMTNPYYNTLILAHNIPSQKIFVHSGRNIALIVETAIKNHILYKLGNDAGNELITRQQLYL